MLTLAFRCLNSKYTHTHTHYTHICIPWLELSPHIIPHPALIFLRKFLKKLSVPSVKEDPYRSRPTFSFLLSYLAPVLRIQLFVFILSFYFCILHSFLFCYIVCMMYIHKRFSSHNSLTLTNTFLLSHSLQHFHMKNFPFCFYCEGDSTFTFLVNHVVVHMHE